MNWCITDYILLWSHVVLFVLHSIALLWPNEWEVISRLFIVDQPISIHCFKDTPPSGPTTQYTTQPGKSAKSRKILSSSCRKCTFEQTKDSQEVFILKQGYAQGYFSCGKAEEEDIGALVHFSFKYPIWSKCPESWKSFTLLEAVEINKSL